MLRPTRRGLAAWLAALAAGLRPARAGADPLTQVFTATASAAAIGQAYLRTAAAPLRAQVMAWLALTPVSLDRMDAASLRRLVAAAVREDFRRGDTVSVDGWVLSALEARLCALAVPAGQGWQG